MPGGTHLGAGRKPVALDSIEVEKLYALNCTDRSRRLVWRLDTNYREPAQAAAVRRDDEPWASPGGRISVRRSQMKLLKVGSATMGIWPGEPPSTASHLGIKRHRRPGVITFGSRPGAAANANELLMCHLRSPTAAHGTGDATGLVAINHCASLRQFQLRMRGLGLIPHFHRVQLERFNRMISGRRTLPRLRNTSWLRSLCNSCAFTPVGGT
jgi:hypothetical protein